MSADMKTRHQAFVMAAKLLDSRPDAFLDPQLGKWIDVLLSYEMTGAKVAHVDKYEASMQAWDWIEGKGSPLSAFEQKEEAMPNWTEHTNKVIQHARRLEASPYAGRRVAKVSASPDFILAVCTSGLMGGGHHVTVEGIPHGATILAKGYDALRDVFWLVVEHESFDLVEDGGIIPYLDVKHTINYMPPFNILRG